MALHPVSFRFLLDFYLTFLSRGGFLLVLLILKLLFTKTTYAIIGFDCGSNNANITTLSLLEVGECDLPQRQVHVEKTYIQLLQITGFLNTIVIQYKVEMHRAITYCGMHSHISVVANGHRKYIQEISRDQCKQMHTMGNVLVTPSVQVG